MEKIDYLCVQILPPTPSGRRATLDYSSHHIMQEPLIPSEVEKDSPAYISVKELKEILLHANSEEGHGVRNIALTGPFGSGKSSILLTVQKEFAEEAKNSTKEVLSFLPISLATLKSPKDSKNAEDNNTQEKTEEEENLNVQATESLNRRIEYSILQQLVYREQAEDVPNSRIKRIHPTKQISTKKFFWLLLFAIIAVLVLFEPSWCRVDAIYNALDFGTFNIIGDIVALSYLVWLCYKYVIPSIAKAYSKYRVDKINLHGAEIKIQQENSIFNHHLDEILYFFSQTKYNVVLIEDLDRFGSPDIFLKLRELSMLINESKIVGRHVSFVYAIKDDIFKDEERTKFFDQIVTVIPFINASNSRDKLKERLGDDGKGIDDDALTDMAFFIQDMRILINIVNEYSQYLAMLSASNSGLTLDKTKLLGMIVYKNYFPEDFAKLHRRDGKVYKVLMLRDKFEQIALQSIKDREEKLKELCAIQNEVNGKTLAELRLQFIKEIVRRVNDKISTICIDSVYYTPFEISQSDSLFDKFYKAESMGYGIYNNNVYSRGYYTDTRYDFQNLIANTSAETKFSTRIKLIIETGKHQLQQEDAAFQLEKAKIVGRPVRFYLQNYKECLRLDEFIKLGISDMMTRFLTEGYIDENYYDYISYFYEGMLTGSDREWVLCVKMDRPKPFNFPIQQVKNVVKELKFNDFNHTAILNINILDFLVDNPKVKEKNLYDKFMSNLKDSDVNVDFLIAYWEQGHNQDKVLAEYVNWDEETTWIVADETSDPLKGDELKIIWCKYASKIPDVTIDWLNDNFDFISDNYELIGSSQIEKIIGACQFKELSSSDDSISQLLIENGSFEINHNNIAILLNWIGNKPTKNCIPVSITNIINCGNDNFIEYLTDKDSLAETIGIIPEGSIEEQSGLIYILNSKDLTQEIKRNYLKHQTSLVENISDIKEDMRSMALELSLISPSWDNIFTYYSTNKANSILIEFICSHYTGIAETKFPKDHFDSGNLASALFLSDKLPIDIHGSLISSTGLKFSTSNIFAELDADRFRNILKSKSINFGDSWIEILAGSNNLGYYIEFFHKEVIQNIDNYFLELTPEAAAYLINSDVLNRDEKIKLYRLLPETIIESNVNLKDFGASLILDDYKSLGWAASRIRNILHPGMNTDTARKLRFSIMTLDESLIDEMLRELGGDYADILSPTKHPKLPKDEFHERLLMFLRVTGRVKSFHQNKDIYRIYPATE